MRGLVIRAVLTGFGTGVAAGVSLGQAPAAAVVSPSADVLGRLGVTAATVQRFTAPARPQDGFAASLVLGGREYTVDLSLDPATSADCLMTLDDGSGQPVTIPAPAPSTYRGSVRGVPGSMVSGGLVDGRLTAVILLGPGLPGFDVLPMSELVPGSPAELHIVYSQDDQVPGDWHCGVDDRQHPAPANSRPGVGSPRDASYYCDIAIEADYPFFVLDGSSASATAQDIATVVANAMSYYMISGANLRFRVVRYIIRTAPQGNPGLYGTSNPQSLLDGLRQVWNNLATGIARDTTHMFTGRDLAGATIGLAYLGTVCNTPYAYGLSQSRFSLQPGRRAALTAHELGHNFNANHCDASGFVCFPCDIMSAVQGNTTEQLTRLGCSTGIIVGYEQSRPCLDVHFAIGGCRGDFNGDGRLDVGDFRDFLAAFAAGEGRADADGDGRVTVSDWVVFLDAFRAGCP